MKVEKLKNNIERGNNNILAKWEGRRGEAHCSQTRYFKSVVFYL